MSMKQQNHSRGENQPLVMNYEYQYEYSSLDSSNSSEVELKKEFRRKGHQLKTWFISAFFILMAFLVINVVTHVLTIDNHRMEKVTEEQYSKKAQTNLETLFNSRPSKNVEGGCRGTVFMMPHCEPTLVPAMGDGMIDVDACSELGLKRAYYLITQFGKDKRWPVPLEIIVLGDKFERSRAIQTVEPLQTYYNIGGRDTPELYKDGNTLVEHIGELFTSGKMCDQVVTVTPAMVDAIPRLAQGLGCGPLDSGCPMSFDKGDSEHAWELNFIYDVADSNSSTDGSEKMQWSVYGNVIDERFDPIAFSKLVGEYGPDGVDISDDEGYPRWMNMSIYNDLRL
jgi:hypothetical protein